MAEIRAAANRDGLRAEICAASFRRLRKSRKRADCSALTIDRVLPRFDRRNHDGRPLEPHQCRDAKPDQAFSVGQIHRSRFAGLLSCARRAPDLRPAARPAGKEGRRRIRGEGQRVRRRWWRRQRHRIRHWRPAEGCGDRMLFTNMSHSIGLNRIKSD